MNPLLFYLAYITPLLAATIYAIVIYNQVLPANRPMLYFVWALLLILLTQSFPAMDSPVYIASENLHYLIEFLLVIWVLHSWKTFNEFPLIVPIIVILALAAWTTERILIGWDQKLSWVRVVFYFTCALMSGFAISRTLVGRPGRVSRNPVFLFCSGLLINYGLFGIFELVAYTQGFRSEAIVEPLFYSTVSVGIIINIIYLTALLCISTRKSFSF